MIVGRMDKTCSSSAPLQSPSGRRPEGVQLISSLFLCRCLILNQSIITKSTSPAQFFSYHVSLMKTATVVEGNVEILAT
jgi:hypothetical protein